MKSIVSTVTLLVIAVSANFAFADCKEYKIIEHENSTEVVCVGDPSATSETYQHSTSSSNSRQNKINEVEENERCTIENGVCYSRCGPYSTDNSRCRLNCDESTAQCQISIIDSLPFISKSNCKKRCTIENGVCYSRCGPYSTDNSRCRQKCDESTAQCQINCLYN